MNGPFSAMVGKLWWFESINEQEIQCPVLPIKKEQEKEMDTHFHGTPV